MPHPPPPLPPSCAKRYEARALLAEGGFGWVVLARQIELDRPVVVKVPHTALLGDATAAERFSQEARVAAALAHPNIVRVIDHGVDGDVPWTVYELVDGETLEQVIARGPLPLAEAGRAAAHIAQALEAAHAAGVIHRDVKAANVIRTPGGLCKLADFGAVRVSASQLTQPGMMLGTPAYVAPEMIRTGVVLPACDIYATGVLLYEMLTGRLPFDATDVLGLLRAHAAQEAPDPRALMPGLPRGLAQVVLACLAKSPKERPDASRLRTLLDPYVPVESQQGTRILPLEVTQLTRVSEQPARGPEVAAPVVPGTRQRAAAAAVGVLAAVALVAVLGRRGPAPEPAASVSASVETSAAADARLDAVRGLRARRFARRQRYRNVHFGAYVNGDAGPETREFQQLDREMRADLAQVSKLCEGTRAEGPPTAPLMRLHLEAEQLVEQMELLTIQTGPKPSTASQGMGVVDAFEKDAANVLEFRFPAGLGLKVARWLSDATPQFEAMDRAPGAETGWLVEDLFHISVPVRTYGFEGVGNARFLASKEDFEKHIAACNGPVGRAVRTLWQMAYDGRRDHLTAAQDAVKALQVAVPAAAPGCADLGKWLESEEGGQRGP